MVLCVSLVLLATPAGAEQASPEVQTPEHGWAYLYDGGAIPFIYGSLALRIGMRWVEPRATPLFFSAKEGGAPSRKDEEVPAWVIGVGSGAMTALIAVLPNPSRWFHVKGMAESLFTTMALTTVLKRTFGRHRPDFVLGGNNSENAHSSFVSGHASTALAATTYLTLYLSHDLFPKYRETRGMLWVEGLSYAGLLGISIYVPYERVQHNRHHISDVVAGSLLGAGVAGAFFYWQRSRFQDTFQPKHSQNDDAKAAWMLLPDIGNRGLFLATRW